MKKYLLLFGLLCTNTLFAQLNFGPKSKIGLVFSADACYRTLSASSADFTASSIMDRRNGYEKPRTGFTTGFSYVYGFGRFAVETGAQYSSKGEQTEFMELRYQMPEPGLPTKAKITYQYNYLDVPFKLLYNFKLAKINFFVSSGASANIFLYDKNIILQQYENGDIKRKTEKNIHDYNPVNFAAMASFGAELPLLNDKVRLRIEPIYRQSVTSIIDAPIKSYLYSAGINAGIFVGL